MEIPKKCETITLAKACVIKAGGGKCGFSGNSCLDQSCATAPVNGTYTSNILCNGYKDGCIVNNNLNGCMSLPPTCAARIYQPICEYE